VLKTVGLLIFAASVAGCGGFAGSGPTTPQQPAPTTPLTPTVTSVAVTCSPTTVVLGASATCTAMVTGANSPAQGVTWTSTNGTVTAAGVFTATAVGTASVTATSVQDTTKNGSTSLTVTAAPITPPPAPMVTSVSVSCAPTTVVVGSSAACTAVVTGTNSPSQNVTWTATNATITAAGALTPTAAGTATAIATSVQDPTKSGTASVTVTAAATPPPTALTLGTGVSPVIAVDTAGNINVAWGVPDGSSIVLRKSTDGGKTFQQIAGLPTTGAGGPQIGVDSSGNVSLLFISNGKLTVWQQSTGTATQLIAGVTGQIFGPSLLVSPSGIATVVWTDGAVFWAESPGDSPIGIAPNSEGNDVTAAGGPQGQVYVFWTEQDGSGECSILASSSLNGTTYTTPQVISPPLAPLTANGCSENEEPFVDPSGAVNVVWRHDGTSVLFGKSSDQGQTFTTPVTVATGTTINGPQLAADANGNVAVTWTDTAGAGPALAVLLSQSPDAGATFSVPTTLSLPPMAGFKGAANPTIALDASGVPSVTFVDDGAGTSPGDFDTYLARSGKTTDLSNTPGVADAAPQVAVGTSATYVLWSDATPNVYFEAVPQ